MFDASDYWITVVQLGSFEKEARRILTPEEIEGLIAYLANHPDEGAVIPETGGLRKLRWAAHGRGKSGGARVIYYFRDLNMPLYLLTVYGKGEKLNLSQREKSDMRKLTDALVVKYWSREVSPRVRGLMKPTA